MPRLKIQNFGPIKTGYTQGDGFFDIPKVTVFIGSQGSGKSTIAKLISTFMWMEKVLVRGNYTKDIFTVDDFRDERLPYHRLEGYLRPDTELEYVGEAYTISFKNNEINIQEHKDSDYSLPHIIYIPSERNIIPVASNAGKLKDIPGALIDFISEYTRALNKLQEPIRLPISDVFVEYNKSKNAVLIKGNDYDIKLQDTASGFQSMVPLYLVSWYLYKSITSKKNGESYSSEEKIRLDELSEKILSNPELTDELKSIALSKLGKRYKKTSFISIIEEPEQNLFPESQCKLLYELLEFSNAATQNNELSLNKLILTTHSPYLIGFLNMVIQASYLKTKIEASENKSSSLLEKLYNIVPDKSLIDISNVAIYQLGNIDDKNGCISKLSTDSGILSDNNYLNSILIDGNRKFDALLEIEEDIES
jgi:predicted ATPase